MPTLLRLACPRTESGGTVLPWREREREREEGGKTGGGMVEVEEKGGEREAERNEGTRITRRKWMVGRNGMWKEVGRQGIAKWAVVHGSTLGSSLLSCPCWSALVFSRSRRDPTRQFSSYPGEYAEARKGSRVYPLFPWLASYGYTFIRRWLYSIWLTRSRNTGGKCY